MNADGANNNAAEEGNNGIDIGILNGGSNQEEQPSNNNNIDDSTNANDQQQQEDDENSYVEPSSLYDVYSSLNYANYTGSCCASDKADGTTLTPALPTTLGLRVNGVGDLPLPLSDWHAKTLKSNRNTVKINNGTYHKSYTVDSNRIRIKNPTWTASIEKLVKTVAYKLGVNPSKLSAELHSLLYMEKGGRVDRCKNTDQGTNVLGTLFVQLPSVFTGGKVSIFNSNGGEDNNESDNKEEEEDASTFQLGAAGDASFSCHFFCHYKDCEYEVAKIKSGSRVLLRYTLRYGKRYGGETTVPTMSLLHSSISSLKWSLEMLPPADRMLLIPMAMEYTALSLSNNKGINAFNHYHRSRLEGIKAAAGEGWKVLIVTAELDHTQQVGYYGDVYSNENTSTIVNIFDETGNDVTETEKWLKDVVDFDSGIDTDGGMMLADDEDEYDDNWGACTSSTSTRNYHSSRTTKKHKYRASFVLAYDTTYSESELKCLSGSEGVAEVVEKVVSTRDYSLLDRMLKVVEKKEKSKFDVRSCQKLLQMLVRSRSQNALSSNRIEFVNRILCGLSSSLEPDDELNEMILSAVDKFGHDNITSGISAVLDDITRMKDHNVLFFLQRVQFILTLNKRLKDDSDYLDKCINKLTSHGARVIGDSASINSTIFTMIEEHEWSQMTGVVEAVLSFMHDKIHSNKSISVLVNRTDLIWKLHDYPCDFIESSLVDFAKDFAISLGSSGHYSVTILLKGDATQKIFVKAICYLMTHGSDESLKQFGSWAMSSEDTLSTLLTAITTHSTELEYDAQVLLRDILNKCLVQYSTGMSGWNNPLGEDRTRDPSLHIQRVLKDHPNLPRMVDGDGRITLHYAAASSFSLVHVERARPESIEQILKAYPEGASIVDPVTGLYPFMLAAGNGEARSVSSSFSLLLADPSLVMSNIQGEVDTVDNRKRKRSESMG